MRDLSERSPETSAAPLAGKSILIPFLYQHFFSYFSPLLKMGKGCSNKGFTLIEVIVTIVAMGIMGVIFMNFMGTAMSRSTRSIEHVRGEARAEAVAEEIVADFVYGINRAEDTAYKLINPSGVLGFIKTKNYGSDVNVNASYITFDSSGIVQSVSSPGTSNTLKVTIIVVDGGNSLTILLTNSRPSLIGSPKVVF
jgi:prepilin-type N-terminal cleavage/methylation domain-containing protein